eukprot:12918030-Prorocentrum_lima.AAC.1
MLANDRARRVPALHQEMLEVREQPRRHEPPMASANSLQSEADEDGAIRAALGVHEVPGGQVVPQMAEPL